MPPRVRVAPVPRGAQVLVPNERQTLPDPRVHAGRCAHCISVFCALRQRVMRFACVSGSRLRVCVCVRAGELFMQLERQGMLKEEQARCAPLSRYY